MTLDDSVRDAIIDKITDTVDVDAIYIFGSHARGDATANSDLDIYIINSLPDREQSRYTGDVRFALLGLAPWLHKDVICRNHVQFSRYAAIPCTVENAVAAEGIKIYG